MRRIRDIAQNRRATTSIEYGLIAGLIFLAMMIGVRNFATTTTGMWNNIAEEVTAH